MNLFTHQEYIEQFPYREAMARCEDNMRHYLSVKGVEMPTEEQFRSQVHQIIANNQIGEHLIVSGDFSPRTQVFVCFLAAKTFGKVAA